MSTLLQPIVNDQTAKSRKGIGGRPRKVVSSPHDPIFKDFLAIFGLSSWDDNKTWTQQDLVDNGALSHYFSVRPKLLKLSYPLNDIRKIKSDDPTQFQIKDLITLLNQFARLYGYCVTSYTRDIKPTKTNGLTRKRCYQVYGLIKMPDNELVAND